MEDTENARGFPAAQRPRSQEEAMPVAAALDLELRGTIVVLPWPDPVVDHDGHDPRSPYVEQFYVALLGPTLTLLLRRLADALDAWPDGFEADLDELASGLGLATTPGGRHGPFGRALGRAVRFGLAQPHPVGLLVRRRLPTLTYRQVAKLPPALQEAHRSWSTGDAA
jgi:hypothetical protein